MSENEMCEKARDIVFMITEKCNSNCIMCPMSVGARMRSNTLSIEKANEQIESIPPDVEHIDITGGEPFLEWATVLYIMERLNALFPDVSKQILTNGRALCIKEIQEALFNLVNRRYRFAIPIHGSNAALHDSICQAPGAFEETMSGLKFLSTTEAIVEVRIVGSMLNADSIVDICKVLCNPRFRIDVVNLIAMEMNGAAARNKDRIWIDYSVLYKKAEPGLLYLISHGIDVGLYGFPLCSLPEYAWGLAKNSISEWKIRYPVQCNACSAKNACGGLFRSTFLMNICPVYPIEEKE